MADRQAPAKPCDVFVERTKPDAARTNILTAIEYGAYVVVGTSGLTDGDCAQFDVLARHGSSSWSDPPWLRGCGYCHVQHDQIVGQRGYFDQLSFFRLQDLQVPVRYPEA